MLKLDKSEVNMHAGNIITPEITKGRKKTHKVVSNGPIIELILINL
jgi:uncharacterized protein Veg